MRRQKYFYLWRSLYNQRRKTIGDKLAAVKIVSRITGGMQDVKLRHYLCRWRDFVERRQAQDDFLLSVCHKRKMRMYRRAFVMWLSHAKREEMAEKYEVLNDMVTKTMFKQKVFLALKHACNQQRAETSELKFTAWKNWCETSRKQKFFAKKEVMVEKIHGLKTERLVKRVFDAIRFHNVQDKFELAREELEVRIPEREALELKKEKLARASATQTKKHLLRQAYFRSCDQKHQALLIWRDYCRYWRQVMDRIKLRLIEAHKRKTLWAFTRMKEGSDRQYHMVLLEQNELAMN